MEIAVAARYRRSHSEFLAWSKGDRDKAIWHHAREQSSCQNCGTRPDEWEDDPDAYYEGIGHCRGCEVRARSQRELDDAPEAYRVGSYAKLIRNT